MKEKEQVVTNGRAVFYTILWESFRRAALDCGWTLALHGSMASDIDIIAVAWIEEAKPIEELIKSLSNCIDGTLWKNSHFELPFKRPHGRYTYTLSIFSDFYIDLSIISLDNIKCQK